MDWINELPEDLLLRILSLLPSARDVVATMVLSKRWKFLWKLVPRLVYDGDSYQDIEYGRFSLFVYRYLLLHEAQVIETVHFKLGENSVESDIGVWTTSVVRRCVRELIIELYSLATLPISLYTGCRMIVTLKLSNAILVDVSNTSFSFPSLKTLSLLSVQYPGDVFVKSFLSNCHVLEDLRVEQCEDDNVTVFTVLVPSLKSLSLHASEDRDLNDEHGFVIDAPCLECLDIDDITGEFCIIENDMPKIATASVNVLYDVPWMILGSITSVKRLGLCLSEDVYDNGGSVFHRLIHLRICTCEPDWLILLMCLLRDSPNLQALRIEQWWCHEICDEDPRPCWNEPSSVPECVLSSLQTLAWVNYEGAEEEKELVAYILRNAKCLNKATISSNSSTDTYKKLEMIKEVSFLPRCSSTCHLIFD